MPDRRQFGLFDFDPASGRLRREGIPVKLQAQPAQVLRLLTANGGKVVSREVLRKVVCGTDKGYQFVAPISQSAAPVVARRRFPWAIVAASLTIVVAIWVLSIIWLVAPPIRVAVAHFDNDTGSAAYDSLAAGLTDSFIAELAAAGPGRFEVIGNASPLRGPKAKRDLPAIGTSLNASYVIPGQLRRDSNQVQAVVSLITLPEQTPVKVARVDLDTSNLFNSQIVAARTIAATFLGPLAAGTRARISSPKPTSH
jgi:TolB-like protein